MPNTLLTGAQSETSDNLFSFANFSRGKVETKLTRVKKAIPSNKRRISPTMNRPPQGHGQPRLGATWYPGGQDDFYMPEVISPSPQRCETSPRMTAVIRKKNKLQDKKGKTPQPPPPPPNRKPCLFLALYRVPRLACMLIEKSSFH